MSDNIKRKKKQPKRRGIYVWECVKTYLANSSIHGVKYLVEDGRHWSERIFWIIICGLSWIGCGYMVSGTIQDFLTHKAAITMDTTYQKWEVPFPSLYFCFSFSGPAKNYMLKILNMPASKARKLSRLGVWSDLGYTPDVSVSPEQFQTMQKNTFPNCDDLFGICQWNEKPIDCCELFHPIATNFGSCLAFNSVHANPPNNPKFPKFVMNHYKEQAKLTLIVNGTTWLKDSRSYIQISLVDSVTLPTQLISKTALLSKPTDNAAVLYDIYQIPTYNDEGVVAMSIADRRCRMPFDTEGLIYLKSYSYHGCIMEAQMKRCYELCGCVSHIFPYTESIPMCNSTELKCAFDNKYEIVTATDDNCWPDCEETNMDVFSSDVKDIVVPTWALYRLDFNMLPGPFKRYHRYTVHSLLDVIVSVGSAIGLFIGASVLSVVELPYWLCLRGNTV